MLEKSYGRIYVRSSWIVGLLMFILSEQIFKEGIMDGDETDDSCHHVMTVALERKDVSNFLFEFISVSLVSSMMRSSGYS